MSDSSRGRDRHREAILARRALFLSTALVTMGCPSQPVDPAPVPAPSHEDVQLPPEPPGLETPWDKVLSQAPPRAVPAAVSEPERAWLEGLASELEATYEAVRVVWDAAPDCDPAAPACKAWAELAENARSTYRATAGPRVSACPGVKGVTGSVLARREAHHRYLVSLLQRVEARLAMLAGQYGADGAREWDRLLTDAKKPPPMPCLKPCLMPEVVDIVMSVPFSKDSALLRVADPEVKQALDEVLQQQRIHGQRAQLVVRGHADPGESRAQALGRERANAVADWLVAAGIPRMDVQTNSLGSDLGVEQSGGDANRRVDFLVVVR